MAHLDERYLVLGGAGSLGSYIIQALLQRGESSIVVCDLREPPAQDRDKRAVYYAGDLCDLRKVVHVLKTVSLSLWLS